MNVLETWLYEATNVLMAPVLAALLVLLVYALVMTGGCLREALERRRAGRSATTMAMPARLHTLLAGFGRALPAAAEAREGDADADADADAVAAACEVEAHRRVSRLNLVARAGPTLGLMATLIPMRPALLALADDDVRGLAHALVAAFPATVVGLLVGLACATMASVRRHWYAADLLALEDLLAAAPLRGPT